MVIEKRFGIIDHSRYILELVVKFRETDPLAHKKWSRMASVTNEIN